MSWLSGLAFCAVLLAPAHAWAWGPITHLVHGAELLQNLTILGLSLQRLLQRHRLAYLYGCVGADITQAKKYTRAQQVHCHSWSVGWDILRRAGSDTERAFAYGYLTHLAGDVYSHNHFIPVQLIASFRSRTLRHIYWEARFDALQQPVHRALINELRRHRFRQCDALVEEVVARTLFSFRTNKRIFDSFIAVHGFDQWYRILQQLTVRSRYSLPVDVVTRYNELCHASVVDLLQHGRRAGCQDADPTGLWALTLAKRIRRTLKALARRGPLPLKLQREIDDLTAREELAASPDISVLQVSAAR